ncbi:MAG: ABC transporter substrate-binding protein [Gammaproteobacteria bacterium]
MLDTWIRRLLFGALSAAVALLSACSPVPQAPLRTAVNIWPGYEPLLLARELGYLDDHTVRLVEYSSDSQALRSYRNGAVDATALTLDESLLLAQEGLRPRIVTVMDFSNGADVIMGRPDIRSLAELKGRRVGVEDTALGAYFLARVLQIAGLRDRDIQVVPLELDEVVPAYLAGRIDVAVTAEPGRTQLLAAGARQLFDSSRIPGAIVDVLVVRQSYLQLHPGRVQAMLGGWYRALDYLRGHPQDAARRMAHREGLTAQQFTAALSLLKLPTLAENRHLLSGPTPALQATAQQVAQVMLAHHLLRTPVDVKAMLDGTLLAKLEAAH